MIVMYFEQVLQERKNLITTYIPLKTFASYYKGIQDKGGQYFFLFK